MDTIVIIGAGFCGALTAVQLLRAPSPIPLRIVLINRSGLMARGLAYGTKAEDHVLNVPAGRMSALAGDENHFVRYAQQRDPAVRPASFVARRLFGDYLEHLLTEAARTSGPERSFRARVGDVMRIEQERQGKPLRVGLSNGESILADRVVLALGNFAPADVPVPPAAREFYGSPRYVRDPWVPGALRVAKPDEAVLLIGSGLTMLDTVLSLRRRGLHAPIHVISRHGLMPQGHRDSGGPPLYDTALPQRMHDSGSLRGMLSCLRAAINAHAQHGGDWRDVLGGLRAATPALWQRLSPGDRARFLRHLRPFWDVHRHRSAPATAAAFEAECARGGVQLRAGRVLGFDEGRDAVRVRWRPRGGIEARDLTVGCVVNCTGPVSDTRRLSEALIVHLRESGRLKADPLGLGLEVSEDYRLIDANGQASQQLYYLGPLLRARYWEATAVPELRAHAARLALGLVTDLEPALAQRTHGPRRVSG